MDAKETRRSLWQRLCGTVQAGFEFKNVHHEGRTDAEQRPMAPGDAVGDWRGEERRHPPRAGERSIMVVPPPAMQRYQAARRTHLGTRRRKQKQSA